MNIDQMKTHLMHDYGMVVRTADDGQQTLTCRAQTVGNALNLLHTQAQARWPADAYVMTEFYEEYPIDEREPPTMARSTFDRPGGPNPVMSRRKKTEPENTLPMFSDEELARCAASTKSPATA